MNIEIGKKYKLRVDHSDAKQVEVAGFAQLYSRGFPEESILYTWVGRPKEVRVRTKVSFEEKYEPLGETLKGWNSFDTFPKDGEFYLVAYDPEVKSTKLAFSELRWDHDREQFEDCKGFTSDYKMHSWLPMGP